MFPNQNKNIKRSNTYLTRKKQILSNLKEKNDESYNNSEFSNCNENFNSQLKLSHKCISVPTSVKVIPTLEEIEKIEQEEAKAVNLIKKLVTPPQKINVNENELKKINHNIFENVLQIYNKIRVIDLKDITLDDKNDDEIQEESVVKAGILSQFEAGWRAKKSKNFNSTIDQFLIENNLQRQNGIIGDKVENNATHSRKSSINK